MAYKFKLTGATATIRARQKIEQTIVRRIVTDVLTAGHLIGIDNGGNDEEYCGADKAKILDTLFDTDEERLYLYDRTTDTQSSTNRPFGFVYLVYGNDGPDVICDYTASPKVEALLKGAVDLADTF